MTRRSYDELIQRLTAIARHPSVDAHNLGEFEANGRAYPIFTLDMGAPGPGKPNVMIAGGIHGDEPGGVETALRFLETNVDNDALLSRFHFVVFPCNNPTGWELDTRENWQGIDLNRQFAVRKPAPEVRLIMSGLEDRCFDLVFEMHEDIDSPGLYLYEIADSPDYYVGERIVSAAQGMGFPVNFNDCIEGMEACGGIIRRNINLRKFRKTRLPQAIYVYRTCGGHVITLEPPVAMLPIDDRVRIALASLWIALDVTAREVSN